MEVGGPGRGHLACGGPAWTLTPVPGQPCATMRLLNLLRRSGSERQAESRPPEKLAGQGRWPSPAVCGLSPRSIKIAISLIRAQDDVCCHV